MNNVRRGRIFRRCTKCRVAVEGRRCGRCGNDRASWTFVVDLAGQGDQRRQGMRGGFGTKAEALTAMAELQRERLGGTYIEPSKLTLGEYLEQWRKGLAEEVRPNTLDEWGSHVRNHLIPHLGSIRLQQLTVAQLRACYRELRASGHKRTGEGLSPKSVWNVHRCLHRALADAVKDGLIKTNPASGAVRRPKERPDIGFWTSAEFAGFLGWVDRQSSLHDQAMYRLAVQTGMRRGELLGLRWRDIDFERGQLTVVQQVARRREISAPKTDASRRTIDLSSDTTDVLKMLREGQEFQRRAWADAYQDHDLAFCRDNGSLHDPRVISHRFSVHVAAAKVKHIRFHDLRHSSAVIGLRELGEWPDEASKRLGHTSVAFTLDTYGHLLPKRGKQIAAAFDQLLTERRRAFVSIS